MVGIASYLISRPVRDVIFSDAKQSAEAIILTGMRIGTAALVIFAANRYIPSRLSSIAQRNMTICIGACLSLPATMLTLGGLVSVEVFDWVQDGATKNFMKGVKLVAVYYAALEFHDIWEFGLLEPAFSWIREKLSEPLARGLRKTTAFIQEYFLLQPLKDVNPFNVRSQQDAERVLLAAQRIAAGALAAFLAFRYSSVLNRTNAGCFLFIAAYAGCYSLSVPATFLASSTFLTIGLIESIVTRHLTKEAVGIVGVNYLALSRWNVSYPVKFLVGTTVGGLMMWISKLPLTREHFVLVGVLEVLHQMRFYKAEVGASPYMPHFFNKTFQSSPNLLDKVFIRVAQRYSGVAFRLLGRTENKIENQPLI